MCRTGVPDEREERKARPDRGAAIADGLSSGRNLPTRRVNRLASTSPADSAEAGRSQSSPHLAFGRPDISTSNTSRRPRATVRASVQSVVEVSCTVVPWVSRRSAREGTPSDLAGLSRVGETPDKSKRSIARTSRAWGVTPRALRSGRAVVQTSTLARATTGHLRLAQCCSIGAMVRRSADP
jgi:hypothetical protein